MKPVRIRNSKKLKRHVRRSFQELDSQFLWGKRFEHLTVDARIQRQASLRQRIGESIAMEAALEALSITEKGRKQEVKAAFRDLNKASTSDEAAKATARLKAAVGGTHNAEIFNETFNEAWRKVMEVWFKNK